MAEQYQVAVGTLRKSLAILESKGLIERVQGSGNYVRFKQNVESVYTHFRLELLDGGGLPMAKTHSIDLMAKEAGFPDFGTSKKAHRIVRLRYLNDVLVALEQIWLDERFTQELIAGDASESLYDFYKTRLNLVISQIEDKISVQSVPDWSPAEFNMPVGALAGYIERIGFDQFDLPAEFSKTWFNPDVCHYVNRA